MAGTQQGENYGILPPKPPVAAKVTTGTQMAVRLVVLVGLLVLGIVGFLMIRDRYQKPMRLYYKALSNKDASKMCQAFPGWLVNAEVDEDAMSIYDMCAAMVSTVGANFGDGYEVEMDYVSRTAVEEEYLNRLEEGILSRYQTKTEISEGWQVQLSVVYSNGGNEVTMTEYARVYRINGSWCLLDVPGSES